MTNIRILPEILSNKIAAGEVVERPASVVKELMENALDAGSTRIDIEVENGGRSLIRVADNGLGMSRDDALLSIERYATSKIFDDSHLFSISTLGFRGEALPSIAAVSRFSLTTRHQSADEGTEIVVEGGRIKRVSETGAPVGTMIAVKQLFFNTPARRKFLKATATEMGHIADTVAGMALGNPGVQFNLYHNHKPVKNWIIAHNNEDRVADILGSDIKNDLYPLKFADEAVTISGWITAPRHARRTSRGVFVFVNGRRVRDRIIRHALFEGYGHRLMKGRFPRAVLFLSVPFDQVDVNVHPTKHEVRFARQKKIHLSVKSAVSQALATADRPRWAPAKPFEMSSNGPAGVTEPVFTFGKEKDRSVFETKKGYLKEESPGPQAGLWTEKPFSDLRIIGQFHGTYILCESGQDLVLIDQHAAHERVVFEQLRKQSVASRHISQKRLVPETVELGYREAEMLNRLIPDLASLGLEIEPFGGNTFAVKAAPAPIAEKDIGKLLTEIVEKTAVTGFGPGLEESLEQCLIIMACHGTIRANQPLSDTEIRHLLKQLDTCDDPSHCPHGRPTFITWRRNELEKRFGRAG